MHLYKLFGLLVVALLMMGATLQNHKQMDAIGSHDMTSIKAGTCEPPNPGTGLLVPAFECTVTLFNGDRLEGVRQPAVTLGPLNQGDGRYFLAMTFRINETIPGWTNHPGSNYNFVRGGVAQPSVIEQAGSKVFGYADVTGGNIVNTQATGVRNTSTNSLGVLHARDYGAVGSADDSAAIQRAIDALPATGGVVLLGDPIESIAYSGHVRIIRDKVYLVGQGRGTILRGNRNDGTPIIHFSGSDGGVRGLHLDCNSLPNGIGLYVGPDDPNQTTTLDHQNYNAFEDLEITSCFDTGIRQQTGPDVAGADSGNWYNSFLHIHINSATRCVHMVDHPTSASASAVNRNNWFDVRCGGGGGAINNVGIFCQACSTNVFTGVHFEGVANPVGPIGTPTAIYIQGQSRAGANNDENVFVGSIYEGNTRDIFVQDANAALNKFIGGNPDPNEVNDNGNGTIFLTSQIVKLPGNLQYSSLNAVMSMNPINGISIDNAAAARLSIGALFPGANAGVNVLSTFRAPNSNWGFPVGIIADTSSRAMLIAAQDYNNATSTGDGIFIASVNPHLRAVTNGGTAETQFGFGRGGITLGPETLALLGAPANGTIRYCADCTPGSNPCIAGGPGAIAFRLNNVWSCQ